MIASAAESVAESSAAQVPQANSPDQAPDKTRRPRAWAPDQDDHFIYWWVKFQGNSQRWVAQQFGVHQGTISRIVQRYERWQAHAEAAAAGRLTAAERLRAQRWLTYERNEMILASCLRLAAEVEGYIDTSKSTVQRPLAHPEAERELRTVNTTADRTGMVARFLRLAAKINMEQLKLVEQGEAPPLPPLTDEQLAAEEAEAAADRAALGLARRRGENQPDEQARQAQEREAAFLADDQVKQEAARHAAQQRAERQQAAAAAEEERLAQIREIVSLAGIANRPVEEPSQEPVADAQSAHIAHTAAAEESAATSVCDGTCGEKQPLNRISRPARITPPPAGKQRSAPLRNPRRSLAPQRLTKAPRRARRSRRGRRG
jgi:hypothetical protein